MDPQCLRLREKPSPTGPKCLCMEEGQFENVHLPKPDLQNLLVSLHHLGSFSNLTECDGCYSYFSLDLDDRFLGKAHLFLSQPPAAAGGKSWGEHQHGLTGKVKGGRVGVGEGTRKQFTVS